MKRVFFWTLFTVFMFTSTLPLTVSGQSTSLSLEPPSIEVPFVDLELGEIVVSVNLTFNNISYLKKFDLLLTFDGSMLEYYTDHAGDWGYGGSRSTNPHYSSVSMSGELTDERIISGSGTFYTFTFRVLSVGSSQIFLQDIYLEDKFGSEIPHVISNDNVTIEIIPLEIWIDGEYADLVQAYDLLLEDFQTLNATYEALLSDYNSLNSTYEQLLSDYNSLNSTYEQLDSNYASLSDEYDKLNTDYDNLTTEHSTLESNYDLLLEDFQTLNATYEALLSDYNSLNSTYEQLDSNYASLSDEYDKLSKENGRKDEEICTKTNLMYLFVVTTIVLGGIAAYLATKKKQQHQTNTLRLTSSQIASAYTRILIL